MLENVILNSAIAYPRQIEEFLHIVPLKHFSKEAQKLLSAILKLQNANSPITIESLRVELGDDYYQSEFFKSTLVAQIIPQWLSLAESFKKEIILNKQSQIAQKLSEASYKGEILDIDLLGKDLEISQQEPKTLAQWLAYYESAPTLPKIPCGIDFLDSCFDGGIECGQLVLISGDPEAGKTMLGVQMLEHIAKKHPVGFFCFEFTIESYLKRHKVKALDNMYIFNDGYDINEICANIKTLYKKGVRVFLIDSQMRITSPQGRNMEEEESLKFSSLARLCHSLKIIVFLIVQTAKGDRDNPMGSKKGGHEASITIRVERVSASRDMQEISEYDENSRLIIVKKNKQTGKHFKDKVSFNPKTCQFSSPNFAKSAPPRELSMAEIEEMIKGL